ncbi:MAG: hypothetical protein BWX54_01962 [Verrucomicrobia bacterium ADurb.Bin018]|nr:MAG: hypothetical protein BWX54_01962 [Verrucomicrobia bacterium ADurb.Bin018]
MKVCICCGARWVDGKGWIDPHTYPCANDNYGWLFCTEVPDADKPHDLGRKRMIMEAKDDSAT